MEIKDIIIRGLKYFYRILMKKKFLNPECICDRQLSNDIIYDTLMTGAPCMISRFGTTEINCINNYLCIHSKDKYINKLWKYITDYTHTPWWNDNHIQMMSIYSGIFPPNRKTAERFSEVYLEDIPLIDILASHQYFEKFMPIRDDVKKIQLEMLYPFFVERPWTRILQGKKVLVVHPFAETIYHQYQKRKLLFDNPLVLPDFDLKIIQAVQSVAGTEVPYKDWFEALEYMKTQISNEDFDICILGCGAYGMPLAAHVKRIGKQAIHMAGGTQLLFGILGKRWVEQYADVWNYRPDVSIDMNYRRLFNDHWCYPSNEERPKAAINVENACYW